MSDSETPGASDLPASGSASTAARASGGRRTLGAVCRGATAGHRCRAARAAAELAELFVQEDLEGLHARPLARAFRRRQAVVCLVDALRVVRIAGEDEVEADARVTID